MSRNCFIRQNA